MSMVRHKESGRKKKAARGDDVGQRKKTKVKGSAKETKIPKANSKPQKQSRNRPKVGQNKVLGSGAWKLRGHPGLGGGGGEGQGGRPGEPKKENAQKIEKRRKKKIRAHALVGLKTGRKRRHQTDRDKSTRHRRNTTSGKM